MEETIRALHLTFFLLILLRKKLRRSDYNHKRKQIVDLLMITDNQNTWHYLTIKMIKRLIRGVTSNHHGDFFCRYCMHSNRTENTLKKHE